eukprot:COSAG02_NODE_44160_length_368_cov_1.148699_1_plen_122_part_11
MKWMLVFEDPRNRTLWLARAVPRVWLKSGKRVAVQDSPTRYGRISYSIEPQNNGSIHANITLPIEMKIPPGGLKLRLRAPGQKKLSSATVGGTPWLINATEETIAFVGESFPTTASLQRIVA